MRLKLDENLGDRGAQLLRDAGHDVATIAEQELCSASDKDVIAVCRKEKRGLVTLDIEFGNPLLFNPSDYSGIAVVRLPHKPTPEDLLAGLRTLAGHLSEKNIEGQLWIIQRGSVREYQPDN